MDRSGLEVRDELHEPEAGRCGCPDCGRPYRRNGEEVSERIDVKVQGHVRRIRRPRYRAACECASRQGRARTRAACAVERRFRLAGANPVQQLTLRLVAARAVHGGNDMG